MRRAEREPEPRGALRHGRRTDRDGEIAFGLQKLRRSERRRGFADDHRHDGALRLRQSDGTLGYSPELCHGEIGKGLNDYDAIFGILKSIGYAGWISVEDGVDGLEQMARSVLFLKRKIAEYYPAEA